MFCEYSDIYFYIGCTFIVNFTFNAVVLEVFHKWNQCKRGNPVLHCAYTAVAPVTLKGSSFWYLMLVIMKD